jgi:hypothetical protein
VRIARSGDETRTFVLFLTAGLPATARALGRGLWPKVHCPTPATSSAKAGAASVARRTGHLDHFGRQGRHGATEPVGFLFQDDNSILIYSMVNANRLQHVVNRPQVVLHFDGDGTGGDIVVFTGTGAACE